jgi:hypothetical protein
MERQAEAEKKLQAEQEVLQINDVADSADVGSVKGPRQSSDNLSVASRPSDETSIRSSGIMNHLKARFKPQTGLSSTPTVSRPAPASNEVSYVRPSATQSPLTQLPLSR